MCPLVAVIFPGSWSPGGLTVTDLRVIYDAHASGSLIDVEMAYGLYLAEWIFISTVYWYIVFRHAHDFIGLVTLMTVLLVVLLFASNILQGSFPSPIDMPFPEQRAIAGIIVATLAIILAHICDWFRLRFTAAKAVEEGGRRRLVFLIALSILVFPELVVGLTSNFAGVVCLVYLIISAPILIIVVITLFDTETTYFRWMRRAAKKLRTTVRH